MGASRDVIAVSWGAFAPHDFLQFLNGGVMGVYVVIAILGAAWLIFND